jgi:mRNA interferase HigB
MKGANTLVPVLGTGYERARFEVAGGNYRLVVAFDFRRQIAFVKFIGTHAQYDTIDVLAVSQY